MGWHDVNRYVHLKLDFESDDSEADSNNEFNYLIPLFDRELRFLRNRFSSDNILPICFRIDTIISYCIRSHQSMIWWEKEKTSSFLRCWLLSGSRSRSFLKEFKFGRLAMGGHVTLIWHFKSAVHWWKISVKVAIFTRDCGLWKILHSCDFTKFYTSASILH